MDQNVFFYEKLSTSPAWPLTIDALRELADQGLGEQPFRAPHYDDPCLVFEDEGFVGGFMSYRYDEGRGIWFVILSYVLPVVRRKGVHTALFSALVERAMKRGDILAIECGTHVDNRAAQAAFEAQGRKPQAILYSYPLKDFASPKPYLEVKL